MNGLTKYAVTAFAVLLLSACGGGGGDASRTLSNGPPEPATVGVLLTDAYGTRWDQAIATITSIELIGDDGHETVFTGEETIDLLSLADYSELFALTEIFPMKLEKVRLRLLSLELVDLDEMGMEIERVQTKLVGNGKMDIVPRGDVIIASGDALMIELDFDMGKAFKSIETGSGKTIVRPVIFARITTSGTSNRLTRVFGTVASIDDMEPTFVLCQTALAGNHHDDDDEVDDDGDDAFDHCLRVSTDDLTAVFDPEGAPVTFASVAVGMELTAIGFLRHIDDDDHVDGDSDDDDGMDEGESESADHEESFDDDFVLDAVALELGAGFERFAGTVQTAVDAGLFDFLLDPGQGFDPDTVVSTEVFANTRVFERDGTELDQLALIPDRTGIVDGILSPGGEGANDHLSAALIVLDPVVAEAEAEALLSGTVISVNLDDGTFDLMAGETPRCVVAGTADIQLVSDSDGMIMTPGALSDLAPEVTVGVFGAERIDGCFVASSVLVYTDI